MFGLKFFVRVQTFRRGPPRAPSQLLPPYDIPRLKNRVKPVPMLHTVGKAASKTHCTDSEGPKGCTTNCTVAWRLSWDRNGGGVTYSYPPSLEWLLTGGIGTSLALAPWSDKKRSPLTWTPSWRQNAAETSASRPSSLGSQVMTKLILYASFDTSTFIKLTMISWPC